MKLELSAREVALKFVYYGPGLSGKTSNLKALQASLEESSRGQLLTLDTADDRTLFFDMLPLSFKMGGFTFRIKIYTVPGQPIHLATRSMVVHGVDGLVFVADSRRRCIATNAASFEEMREHIAAQDLKLPDLPLVIQFNKRDLRDIRSDEELNALAHHGRELVYPAVASRGDGVIETFLAALRLTWRSLETRYQMRSRIGVSEAELLEGVAEKFGALEPVDVLLARRFGEAA